MIRVIILSLLLFLVSSCVATRNSLNANENSTGYENSRPVEYHYDNNVRCYVVYWYNYQGSAGGISCVAIP